MLVAYAPVTPGMSGARTESLIRVMSVKVCKTRKKSVEIKKKERKNTIKIKEGWR